MEKTWKSHLQEYCQKSKLRYPNYSIRNQSDSPTGAQFQVQVEVDGRWYVSDENCPSKKAAEQSAAQKACADLIRDHAPLGCAEVHVTISEIRDTDSSKHLPPEYSAVEDYLATMVKAWNGRIRKVQPWAKRGLYKVDIAGDYRYCDNVQKNHKKNQVYFLVDPINKCYYQKCYDPDCKSFQSDKKRIYTS